MTLAVKGAAAEGRGRRSIKTWLTFGFKPVLCPINCAVALRFACTHLSAVLIC